MDGTGEAMPLAALRQKNILPFDQLNEAVNFELGSIFIAVPKAGTTSIRSQIRPSGRFFFPQPHLDIMQVRDLFYPYRLYAALSRNRAFPSPAGLLTDRQVRLEAKRLYDGLFKFAAVRNPWARAASLYFRQEGVRTSEATDFATFIGLMRHASDTCVHPTVHANQVDWLKDETGRIAVDFVYRVEEMGSAVARIAELTGGRLKLKALHENENARARAYRDLYDLRSREIVRKRFEEDIDTFGYVF